MNIEFEDSSSSTPTIELTPLIDVIFQILVFIMISSTFAEPMMDIILPQAETEETQVDHSVLSVQMDRDGNSYIKSERIPQDQLLSHLRKWQTELDTEAVYFKGDQEVPYKHILEAMNLARQAGLTQFNFVYEESE
ncbi:MAG: biopolymer transporter ExbD [Verrucomicrobiota bacterium]